MATNLISSRLMIRNAARMLDLDHPVNILNYCKERTIYISMAKRYATDACSVIADDALQMHGGYGYL